MKNVLGKSCLVYSILLGAYPHEFRQRFGNEMVATFSDQMLDEQQRSGFVGVMNVWRLAAWELVSIGVPMLLKESMVAAMAISFLGSSALFVALLRAVSPTCSK
jgi:hypothetical protein